MQAIPNPPILNIYPPNRSRPGSLHDSTSSKEFLEEIDLGRPDAPESSLDPSSIPLRVVYSPAVSRSGSIAHNDRPSIVVSLPDESGDNPQIISTDSSPTSSRLRSNSFEVRSQPEGTVHRRNLSRHNSTDSSLESPAFTVESSSRPLQTAVLGSNNRRRRLTIEEVAEDSDGHSSDVHVFKAFHEKRWWKGVVVAKVALAIVTTAVLGNLIYT